MARNVKMYLADLHLKLHLDQFKCHHYPHRYWTTYSHKCLREISLPRSFFAQTRNTSTMRERKPPRKHLIYSHLNMKEPFPKSPTVGNRARTGKTNALKPVDRSLLIQDTHSHRCLSTMRLSMMKQRTCKTHQSCSLNGRTSKLSMQGIKKVE